MNIDAVSVVVRALRNSSYGNIDSPIVGGNYYGEHSYNRKKKSEPESSRPLLTRISLINNSVPMSMVNEAIKSITDYSLDITPDYVVGVNRGGTMVAAFISLFLGVPSSNFLRCYIGEDYVECSDTVLSGKVLVVDDICRSGSTMKLAEEYLLQTHPEVDRIYTASLFSFVDENKKPAYSSIDYFSFPLSVRDAELPWNINEETRRVQFDRVRNDNIESLISKIREGGRIAR